MREALCCVGEKVLVPYVDRHYEAKVLKVELRDDGVYYYLLHYTGWNKKWDEWVEESGLQKVGPPEASTGKRSNGKALGNGDSSQNNVPKKRKVDELTGDAAPRASQQIEVDLPANLKKQLVDEWDVINQQGRTVPLPRKPNAAEVLRQFVQYGGTSRTPSQELRELATGLEEYFDKALSHALLYRAEREDAEKHLKDGVCASAVFGAEHLLRLLMKLPELVPSTAVSATQIANLNNRLLEFVQFLQGNHLNFFARFSEYRFKQPSPPSHEASGIRGGAESGNSMDGVVGM